MQDMRLKRRKCRNGRLQFISVTAYAHDRLGRVVSRNGDAFGYDARSQVVSATVSTNAYGYSYDSIGNSVHASRNAATNYYLSNELNQYEVVGDGADFSFLSYDADGNQSEWNGYGLQWDPENRLYCGWRNGSEVYSAFRDWNGRAFCEIEETFYADRVFDGWNPVFERAFDIYSELPLSETVYVWGTDLSGSLRGAGGVGGLLAVNRDGDWYVPLYDANGNVTAYVSEGGSVVAEYEYDAFGNTISQSGAMSDDFRHRFSTKPWIAALGVYDYGERMYSPELRRWLSRDPIGEEGGVNLYAMCGNDAVNGVDIFGLKGCDCPLERALILLEIKVKDATKMTLSNPIEVDMNWDRKISKLPYRVSVYREYGGYICCDEKTGQVSATGPFPGTFKYDVDGIERYTDRPFNLARYGIQATMGNVFNDSSKKCPLHTTTLAFYHSHPPGNVNFSPDDKNLGVTVVMSPAGGDGFLFYNPYLRYEFFGEFSR